MQPHDRIQADHDRKDWLRSPRLRSLLAISVMLIGVAVLYRPWLALENGQTLFGFDYLQLHLHRLRYAHEALFAAYPHLPAWYSRELLGAPFWSNMQSFPFIPTRLLLLLADPWQAYALGVNLAAGLAALFTYLYCRRIGLAPLPAASSGWTFAASGFFASRLMAGHLPLLEAYPALPCLLWLVERAIAEPSRDGRFDFRLLALSLGSGCVVLAGHPQLPAYALTAAFLYLLYRTRSTQILKPLCAILLGVGLAGFVLWPMFRLIGRSTRLLPLEAPQNDILFPYGRLGAYLFPWKDGFPDPFSSARPFIHYSNYAYFWDTVCYVGWVPLLAVIYLMLRGEWSDRPRPFFVILGSLALILALPFAQPIRSLIPGTILRSPSRQVYLTTFTLALALGWSLESLGHSALFKQRQMALEVTVLVLALHVLDLGRHDLHFIHSISAADFGSPGIREAWRTQIGDQRIAVDCTIASPLNREIDDIGFFDSIILARPYRALLDLTGMPETSNIQNLDGSQLSARALAVTATKLVITSEKRDGLPRVGGNDSVNIYAVPSPAPRAAFLPFSQARFLDGKEIHRQLANPNVDVVGSIMLPPSAANPAPPRPATPDAISTVTYQRPSSDLIVLKVGTDQDGFLRVMESFDPGWQATVDGAPTRVFPADDFALAVRLDPGTHEVRLRYSTPGATSGAAISLISLVLLILLVVGRHPTVSGIELHRSIG